MLALAVRGLAARKLRASLTAIAILLGVAMVAGTFMLKASLDRGFDDIFAAANAGIDVTITPKLAVEGGFGGPQAGTALPASLTERVASIDDVEQAAGTIDDGTSIAILGPDGKRIGPPSGGPPQLTESVVPAPFSPFTWVEGGPPSGPAEVGIDSITADQEGYRVGQRITISGARGARRYTLSGIGRFGTGVPLGGASIAVFTLAEAQSITGKQGKVDSIDVEAADGVSPEQLVSKLEAAGLPGNLQIRTGAAEAAQQSADIKDGFSFLSTALLAFAGVALFVGAFLIFNTFSITIAQRIREFGLLRTLGASSRQILASVVVEALIVGIVASLIGIGAGIGFVALVSAAFKAAGFELPQSGLVIGPATIVIPLIVGVLSTVGSAAIPAVRATRVTALTALSDVPPPPQRPGSRRDWIARGVAVAGIALIAVALFATSSFGSALPLLGLGLVALFIGIAMLGASVIKPLASVVGRPVERLRGVTGRLARENTLRNPARTATTSAALMIGVALVVFATVFASSATSSVGTALDQTFIGDLTITGADGFSPIPSEVGRQVGRIDGVETVSPISGAPARIATADGSNDGVINGLDFPTLGSVGRLDWVDGSDELLTGIGPSEAIAEQKWAADNGVGVGDSVELTAPDGQTVEAKIVGTVRDRVSLLVSTVALPIATVREGFDARQDFADLIAFGPGADYDAVRARIDALLTKRFPQAESRSQQELKDQQREGINRLLAFIYVLLALSIVLSLFGVVNTLVLTVYERTREIGMLRAIGAARPQIRRMIRYEALITALIGAIIGAVVGLAIAIATVAALADDGLLLSIPVVAIAVVLVAAGFAGVIAGIWPARRASRIEVIEALQYE